MKTIIVMAVYGRKRLVEINLQLLSKQDCEIVTVVSLMDDSEFIRSLNLPKVHVIPYTNKPLGKKWQAGVNYARELGADQIIILGSDDFLNADFIKQSQQFKNYDFIFFTHWYIHDLVSSKNYFLKYKNVFPLGSGRIFSKEFLDNHNWQLFDSTLDIHLDDYVFNNLRFDDRILMNPHGMNLLAVKGRWEVLNPLDKILNADTIEWDESLKTEINLRLGYNVEQTFKNI